MHHQHDGRITRSFIDIMHTQICAVGGIGNLHIMWLKRKIMDIGKGAIGCAKDFQKINP